MSQSTFGRTVIAVADYKGAYFSLSIIADFYSIHWEENLTVSIISIKTITDMFHALSDHRYTMSLLRNNEFSIRAVVGERGEQNSLGIEELYITYCLLSWIKPWTWIEPQVNSHFYHYYKRYGRSAGIWPEIKKRAKRLTKRGFKFDVDVMVKGNGVQCGPRATHKRRIFAFLVLQEKERSTGNDY